MNLWHPNCSKDNIFKNKTSKGHQRQPPKHPKTIPRGHPPNRKQQKNYLLQPRLHPSLQQLNHTKTTKTHANPTFTEKKHVLQNCAEAQTHTIILKHHAFSTQKASRSFQENRRSAVDDLELAWQEVLLGCLAQRLEALVAKGVLKPSEMSRQVLKHFKTHSKHLNHIIN